MKNTLKGTLTEENLLKAFAGESQARNRYNYFASVARREGYEQIAAVFDTTADQEKEHAKRFFKYIEGGMATIHNASFPAGIIATTAIFAPLMSTAPDKRTPPFIRYFSNSLHPTSQDKGSQTRD